VDALSEQDLRALSAKATAEIQADQKELAALERKIQVNIKWRQAIQARLSALFPSSEETGYGRKWDNIRDAIRAVNKAPFTQTDVEKELRQIDPEADIDRDRLRATLWTMQAKGELIKQIQKGNNQQPALFEKLASKCPQRSDRSMVANHHINGPK
jgi:hypothetical protein